MGSAPRDDLQVLAPACGPPSRPSSGRKQQLRLDASPSCPPPVQDAGQEPAHSLLLSLRSGTGTYKRGYMTKGRSVQTGPVFQACRVHSLAGQSHTPGRALLPQDSGLPPRGLCGPSWHPHPPSAKCLLKEGAWRCPHVTSEDVFHRGSPLSRSHGS